ncbi:MAG: orotidine-5'-phosphate decarboxylase [Dehalococcoidia bacterium]|nr:orotidine-5'-phosphate decarboxylase [Dehalococcoidia bacterium]
MGFKRKLYESAERNNSLLCVGLDPDPEKLPEGLSVAEFNRAIIQATSDIVCAYKPNLAFYEAAGFEGLRALEQTIAAVPPHIPVIGDAKRGDIGNTARQYARALFELFNFDAVTVSPYLGFDSVEPFISYVGKGTFMLCRTSNPGARDFQDLMIEGQPLYEHVAFKALEWNIHGNIGLVVGATYPQELARIRQLCPEMPLLIPGVGTQGGDIDAVVRFGTDSTGMNAVINVSRAVLYASKGTDFAEAARNSALKFRDEINQYRNAG